MIFLMLIGVAGLGTLSFGIFNLVKKKPSNKWLTRINGIALGYYLGYLLLIPINYWDERQRNLSGQIVVEKLEEFKALRGKYPDKLTDLDLKQIDTLLPLAYKSDRFNYSVRDNKFDLDIPIPIMDRWHWNNDKKIFDYSDF